MPVKKIMGVGHFGLVFLFLLYFWDTLKLMILRA
jgi:hypothetical protein